MLGNRQSLGFRVCPRWVVPLRLNFGIITPILFSNQYISQGTQYFPRYSAPLSLSRLSHPCQRTPRSYALQPFSYAAWSRCNLPHVSATDAKQSRRIQPASHHSSSGLLVSFILWVATCQVVVDGIKVLIHPWAVTTAGQGEANGLPGSLPTYRPSASQLIRIACGTSS